MMIVIMTKIGKSQNIATIGSHLIFKAHLQKKNIQNSETAEELATVLLNAFCVNSALKE